MKNNKIIITLRCNLSNGEEKVEVEKPDNFDNLTYHQKRRAILKILNEEHDFFPNFQTLIL